MLLPAEGTSPAERRASVKPMSFAGLPSWLPSWPLSSHSNSAHCTSHSMICHSTIARLHLNNCQRLYLTICKPSSACCSHWIVQRARCASCFLDCPHGLLIARALTHLLHPTAHRPCLLKVLLAEDHIAVSHQSKLSPSLSCSKHPCFAAGALGAGPHRRLPPAGDSPSLSCSKHPRCAAGVLDAGAPGHLHGVCSGRGPLCLHPGAPPAWAPGRDTVPLDFSAAHHRAGLLPPQGKCCI